MSGVFARFARRLMMPLFSTEMQRLKTNFTPWPRSPHYDNKAMFLSAK
jgi:hypothetical protein